MTELFDPQTLNRTELAAAARQIDPEAHRNLPEEVLVAIIEGRQDDVLPPRRLNKMRLKIMQFLDDNWDQVSYQISCPAKTRDRHACFGCTDLQVSCCTIDNAKTFLDDR